MAAQVEHEIRAMAAAGFDHLLCDAASADAGVLQAAKAAGMAPLLHLPSLPVKTAGSATHAEAAPAAGANQGPDDGLPDPRFSASRRPDPPLDFNDAGLRQRLLEDGSARLIDAVREDGWAGICLGLAGSEPPALFTGIDRGRQVRGAGMQIPRVDAGCGR
jgi:hypothetical protein